MKKYLLPLCILLLSSFQIKAEKKVDYFIFSGKIEHPYSESFLIEFNGKSRVIKISKDGSFLDTLKSPKEGYYSIYFWGSESSTIYVKNGETLFLSINEKFDQSVKYSGTLGAENNLYTHVNFTKNNLEKSNNEYYSLSEKSFVEKTKTISSSLIKLIEKSDASDNYKVSLINDTKYNHSEALLNYQANHRIYTGNQTFKVSKLILENTYEYKLDDEEAYNYSKAYQHLLLAHLEFKAAAIYVDSLGISHSIFEAIKAFKNQTIKDELLHEYSSEILKPNKFLKDSYKGLLEASKNLEYNKEYTQLYKTFDKLTKGKPSPTFIDYVNHKGGKTSLSDLKGKYIYIDIWATWCKPCIAEFPSLQLVEEKYLNKNIQFVSISIDNYDKYDGWFKMVLDKQLGGVQLLAVENAQSNFKSDYRIQTIPRFILIDPEGNIIDSNAPRPSNPKLLDLLEDLNIQ